MRRLVPAALLVTLAAILVPSTAWAGSGRTVITTSVTFTTTANYPFVWTPPLTCPSGTKVLGAGGTVSGADHAVGLFSVSIDVDGSRASVGAIDYAGIPSRRSGITFTVDAWAVCGIFSAYEVVRTEVWGETDDTPPTATAVCPAGKRVIAAGGHAARSWGLDSIDVPAVLAQVRVDGHVVLGAPRYPQMVAEAVCVTAPLTQQRITGSSASGTGDQSASVTCPSGTLPYGVSGGVSGAAGQATIRSLTFTGSTATIRAQWLTTVPVSPWYAFLRVICA
jgi:hypothetical protein